MFCALASSLFISGNMGNRRPRWARHRQLGVLPSHPAARVRLPCAGRWKVHGGLNGSSGSWGVPGQRVKTREFQGRPGKSHPAAAPCPPRHLRREGFLCRQRGEHLPGQLQAPRTAAPGWRGTGNAPAWGGTPGVLGSASAWGEPMRSRGLPWGGGNPWGPGVCLSVGGKPWGFGVCPDVGGAPGDLGSAPVMGSRGLP